MKKEILISSDGNYDNLVAEIYIDDKYIALVSYDEDHNFFVETPTTNRSNEEIITHKVEYNTFIELLEEAKRLDSAGLMTDQIKMLKDQIKLPSVQKHMHNPHMRMRGRVR